MSGILDFADGSTWIIPEGWGFHIDDKPSSCRSCAGPVLWLANQTSGKKAPFDANGVNHFATCPQADQWRKR